MRIGGRGTLAGAVLVAAAIVTPVAGPDIDPPVTVAVADRTPEPPAISADELISAIDDVPEDATYGTRDDRGNTMDTAKIIADPDGGYLAVYHHPARTHLATSADLKTWRHRVVLDPQGVDPTIVRTGDGGFLLGVEHKADVGNHLRLAYYRDVAALLAARPAQVFNVPRTLSTCNEGTPNIYSADLGPDPARSTIVVGFHYQAPNRSGGGATCGYDRQAVGTLTGFRTWKATRRTDYDGSVVAAAKASGVPVNANIGDRDVLTDENGNRWPFELIEAGGTNSSHQNWRIFLHDAEGRRLHRLAPRTRGGSTGVANPTFTLLTGPSGRRELVVAMWIHGPGAAPGEAGQLIYHTPLGG